MTTEYKLNTYIEWTDEDRAKGECPVPVGSDVTMWFEDMDPARSIEDSSYDWGDCGNHITAYLIHSVPREPIVRWLVVGGYSANRCFKERIYAEGRVDAHGGRVVKLVEEME